MAMHAAICLALMVHVTVASRTQVKVAETVKHGAQHEDREDHSCEEAVDKSVLRKCARRQAKVPKWGSFALPHVGCKESGTCRCPLRKELSGEDPACQAGSGVKKFDAVVLKGKGCSCEYPVAGYIDGMKPGHTPPYAQRFDRDVVAAASADLKHYMCKWYFKADAHPEGTHCRAWVSENVRIEDGPMVTARAGDPANPLVVFIHGWPDSAALWVNQFMHLSDRYHCVAVQLPNYIDALPLEELYLDEVVSRIGEVIGGQKAYLVGHDWGANFGYMVAYKFPENVLKYAALDIGNDLQMWTDTQRGVVKGGVKALFIGFYQKKLKKAYLHEEEEFGSKFGKNTLTVDIFAVTGGSPSRRATARMGMYYDRAWNRDEYCKRLAPDVAPADWESLWTPLGGTGIPQKGLLYIQGSNLATTPKFLQAVRDDEGKVVELMRGGHWIPKGAAKGVNAELDEWLAKP